MADLFSNIFDWMEALPPLMAYLAILVVAYGENIVPPIPGDMVVVFGGYLVGIGKLNFALVWALSTVGGAAGFMTMYAVGFRIGDAVLAPEHLRWLPKDQIGKAQRWLNRWGYGVIAANRFLSGLRSVISLTVGMAHTDAGKTTLYCTLSAFVWTGLIAYGGYAVGDNWSVIGAYLRQYGKVVIGLLFLLALIQVVRYVMRRKRAQNAGPDDA